MNDIVKAEDRSPASMDFAARQMGYGANVGSVAIEQERAIAEVQGQIIIAQRCPRNIIEATAEFLEACKMPEFAEKAFYSVPNRGSGPSIRFAEEAARCYGNFQFGHRELSRTEGKSEVEVYAWDVQKNNRSTRQITVMHVMDSRNGSRPLKDQADIDNKIANVASKQMRGRILALLPKALVAAGEAMAKKTLAGGNDKPLSAKIVDMVTAFADHFSVTAPMLETYVGHKLDTVTIDEFADLRGVFNALREGAKVSEYFNADGEVKDEAATSQNDKLDKVSKRGQAKATERAAADGDKDTKTDEKAAPKKEDPKPETKPEPEKEPEKAKEEPKAEPKAEPVKEQESERKAAPEREPDQTERQREPGDDDDTGDEGRFAPPADEKPAGPRESVF